jgi:ribosomal protein L12E/L44/L45/RPP1/RPP2
MPSKEFDISNNKIVERLKKLPALLEKLKEENTKHLLNQAKNIVTLAESSNNNASKTEELKKKLELAKRNQEKLREQLARRQKNG